MYNFSSVSFKMPSKWTFHQNSSLQHIIWNVMSYLRQLRHEMIVLLNWLIAVEKFGTFKKTFVEHYSLCLVILIVQKWKIQWRWWWWMILRVVSSTVCRCKLFVVNTFFISFKPLILSKYGKITWILKIRIILLVSKFSQ